MAKTRTIDSTQFSLKELQRLEVERIERELEEKRRQHAAEVARREAAMRAIEQAQLDAQRAAEEALRAEERRREEARLQAEHEARLAEIKAKAEERAREQEIELRKANAQMLQAQVELKPRRRMWPILVLAMVFGLQAFGFKWYQDKADANRDAISVELSRAEQRAADAEKTAKALNAALADATAQLDELESTADQPADPAPADKTDEPAAKPPKKKDPKDIRKPPPPPPDDDGRIDLSKCDVHSPLGCIKRK